MAETAFTETEILLAIDNNDYACAQELLAGMSYVELVVYYNLLEVVRKEVMQEKLRRSKSVFK